jgi:copper chaperone CopZ
VITTLDINGMTCNGCVKHVDQALRAVPGVTAVEVSLPDHCARIVHDPELAPPTTLVAAVEGAGYSVPSGHGSLGPRLEGS